MKELEHHVRKGATHHIEIACENESSDPRTDHPNRCLCVREYLSLICFLSRTLFITYEAVVTFPSKVFRCEEKVGVRLIPFRYL